MKIRKAIALLFLLSAIALAVFRAGTNAQAAFDITGARPSATQMIATIRLPASQGVIVVPEIFTVAPNQPVPEARSTVGLINALCDVTLDIVGCGFMPTSATIACDTNGDAMPELLIPLKNITLVNRLLVRATLPALAPHLAGTPFPLTCCGGVAHLTLSRTVGAGDDNIFGPYTQSVTCPIDLGIRAPVVVSATPSNGDCSTSQNLLIPGSCFLLADRKPNVTSVYAVDRNDPNHIIQATNFQIMNPNLIDALFEFGPQNAGKAFLIYASGPNGTSRNLAALPSGAPPNCPLGNEAGTIVIFTCDGVKGGPGAGDTPPPPTIPVVRCDLDRSPSSGAFNLIVTVTGEGAPADTVMTVGGFSPKKIKFADQIAGVEPPRYRTVILKGKVCRGLPGVITGRGGNGVIPVTPFACGERCPD